MNPLKKFRYTMEIEEMMLLRTTACTTAIHAHTVSFSNDAVDVVALPG